MTTMSPTATDRSVRLPSARALYVAVYGVCVLLPLAVFVGSILFTDEDPYKDMGAVESIVTIGIISTVALAISLGVVALTRATPERAKIGAVTLAALSVPTIVVFWSGTPGILAAGAATLSGITRGGRPLAGAGRVAGIVGVFVAALSIVLTIGAYTVSWIAE